MAGWVARGSGAGGPRSLDGWHELGPGPAILDGWHAAQELGARGVWSWGPTDFWHAAKLGACGFGCQELRTRLWSWGTQLWGWEPAEFGCWMELAARLRSWARGVGWVARRLRSWRPKKTSSAPLTIGPCASRGGSG